MNKLNKLFEDEFVKKQLLFRLEKYKNGDVPLYSGVQAFNVFVLSIELEMLMFLQGRTNKIYSDDIELFKVIFNEYLPSKLKEQYNPQISAFKFGNLDHKELVSSILNDIWKDYVELYPLPLFNQKTNGNGGLFQSFKKLFKH